MRRSRTWRARAQPGMRPPGRRGRRPRTASLPRPPSWLPQASLPRPASLPEAIDLIFQVLALRIDAHGARFHLDRLRGVPLAEVELGQRVEDVHGLGLARDGPLRRLARVPGGAVVRP